MEDQKDYSLKNIDEFYKKLNRENNNPIKIGIIGAGNRADSLFNSLMFDEDLEELIIPQAILDINENLLKNWRYKVENLHTSLDSFLKDDLDAVIIGTPPSTHAEFAKKFLELGINVWSEVPMGLSVDEIWSIIDAEKGNKSSNGKYCYGENYCFMLQPQFVAMKHEQGAIGEIYYCESEYSHSIEHYMIEENYLKLVKKELDPEIHVNTKPTWRTEIQPLVYGHALGTNLYVLNHNETGEHEYPVEISAMGNMKIMKRFNKDNFQIALVKTNKDTIIKFVIAFVMAHHGRIYNSYWATRGMFMGANFQADKHYYYEVPKDKENYPDRHEQETKILSDEDLVELGTPNSKGGHGGGDKLMFKQWIMELILKKPHELNSRFGAEMTAPGIIGQESMRLRKHMEIPRFE